MIIWLGRLINTLLARFGYRITSLDFINASRVERMAKLNGMSVPDYIESKDAEIDVRHIGKSQRIVERILKWQSGNKIRRILEIGPGTGRYMAKFLSMYPDVSYEIYETAFDWRTYLKRTYGGGISWTLRRPTGERSPARRHVRAISRALTLFSFICLTALRCHT